MPDGHARPRRPRRSPSPKRRPVNVPSHADACGPRGAGLSPGEALEEVGDQLRRARVVEAKVLGALGGSLAAEAELLRREDLLSHHPLDEPDGELLLAARHVDRRDDEPLDELVVEGGRVQLAHAAQRLALLAAREELAHDLAHRYLEVLDASHRRAARRAPPHVAPPAAEVCRGELRARVRERLAHPLGDERLGGELLDKGGRQHVVGDGAHEEGGEQGGRGGDVECEAVRV
mmetsp:Transcript_27098/g.87078  ORF Transcript_27098/g.87078 Transcript_27098/m.87078 type:complete len:233 (-) Transcript_27098:966-1664(-)